MSNFKTLIIYTVCYAVMFLFTWISKLNNSNRLFNTKGLLAASTGNLIGLHVAGIFFLGLVPLTMIRQSYITILPGSEKTGFSWLMLFVFLMVFIVATGFRAGSRIKIRQQGICTVSNNLFAGYFFVRALFLCAYEFFFRGMLLFDGIKWWGILPAVILSTGLTVFIHVFTNKKEMWACIPFGITLCSCCIAFNAVWPAMVLHLVLSMAYEIPPTHHFLNQLKLVR